MLKKVIGLVMSMAMIIGCMPATLAQAAQVDDNAAQTQDSAALQSGSEFDPETVMWTNNPIENVLAQEGIYKTVKDVNPNKIRTLRKAIIITVGSIRNSCGRTIIRWATAGWPEWSPAVSITR